MHQNQDGYLVFSIFWPFFIVFFCVLYISVTALDLDSGVNAELEYSVDSEFFYVETVKRDDFTYSGIIKVKK